MANGLMNRQQQGGARSPQRPGQQPGMGQGGQGGGQPPGPGEQEGAENVTPEEQAEYDEFVTNGMNMMYNEQVLPQIMETLESGGDPIEGLAHATALVVLRLDESARQQNKEVSGDVKFHGAVELQEQLAELANEAGIHEFSEDDMESALFQALDLYRETQAAEGELPTEQLKQDMAVLMKADQEGQLDQMVPGASEYAKKRAPEPQQGEGGGGQRPQGGGGQPRPGGGGQGAPRRRR